MKRFKIFIEIEENTFLNTEQIVTVELIIISSEPYGETYQWVFYTNSSGDKTIFHDKIFDNKNDAISWFDNIRYLMGKK